MRSSPSSSSFDLSFRKGYSSFDGKVTRWNSWNATARNLEPASRLSRFVPRDGSSAETGILSACLFRPLHAARPSKARLEFHYADSCDTSASQPSECNYSRKPRITSLGAKIPRRHRNMPHKRVFVAADFSSPSRNRQVKKIAITRRGDYERFVNSFGQCHRSMYRVIHVICTPEIIFKSRV